MALPITGPFSKSVETPQAAFYRTFRKDQTIYRQKAPFTLPLQYSLFMEQALNLGPYPQNTAVNSTGDTSNLTIPFTRPVYYSGFFAKPVEYATRTARMKFSKELRPDTSQLASLLIERKQTLNVLSNRATQLAAFMWWLKRDPIRAFSSVLPSHDKKGWKRVRQLSQEEKYRQFKRGSRGFADLHLELMFGLLPTYSDIESAVRILGSGVPPCVVREKGSYSMVWNTGAMPTGTWRLGATVQHNMRSDVTVGALVSVSNPNVFLANQLGLINPASIIWEHTPWSFVVDYFLNVGDWLGQWTETWGLTVQQPYYSVYASDRVVSQWYTTNGAGKPVYQGQSISVGTKFERKVGALPTMSLGIKKPWTLSAARASTSVALLLQRLPR